MADRPWPPRPCQLAQRGPIVAPKKRRHGHGTYHWSCDCGCGTKAAVHSLLEERRGARRTIQGTPNSADTMVWTSAATGEVARKKKNSGLWPDTANKAHWAQRPPLLEGGYLCRFATLLISKHFSSRVVRWFLVHVIAPSRAPLAPSLAPLSRLSRTPLSHVTPCHRSAMPVGGIDDLRSD